MSGKKKRAAQYPEKLKAVEMRQSLMRRLKPQADVEVALAAIHEKLAEATLRIEQVGDGGRLGVGLGMVALIDFFTSVGIPGAALQPVFQVWGAIDDATRGIESPIFRPDQVGSGSPPTPGLQLEFEGHLAFITECCVRHCRMEGIRDYMVQGCKLAAELVRKSGLPANPTDTELRELRERVRASKKDRPDKLVFWQLLDTEEAREDPLTWAKGLLLQDWMARPAANFLSNPVY